MTAGQVPFKYVFFCAAFVVACDSFGPALADESPFVHTGECTLTEGEGVSGDSIMTNFEICLNGRVGSQISFVSGNSKENFTTSYVRGSTGLHLTEYVSVFGEGFAQRRAPLGADAAEFKENDSTLMALRIGNAAIHGFALTSGKFSTPFGIGIDEASQSYRYFSDKFHWTTYEYGHWLTLDDLKNFLIDISYVGETVPGGRVKSDNTNSQDVDWGGSARIAYDFSALEGSRLVGSVYGQKSGMRRSGLGFISVNSRGDTNWIEFVRTRMTPDSQTEPFRQLIKFGYLSSWRSGGRWSVAVEEDRNTQRLGEFAHHISVFGYGQINIGLLLRRTLIDKYQDRWHVTSGLEASF